MVMRTRWLRFASVATLLAVAALSPQAPTATAAGVPDYRFGVVEAYAAPAAATALGAGWERVTFEWNRIQPNGPDEWNIVPISDQVLANELGQGRQVVGLLITTPGWATDLGIGPGVPRGLYLPTDNPNNLWANFVRTIVTRYAGRIDHWTIWNEPEIPPGSPDMTWGGSTKDFIQLLRVAYTVAKEANPNSTIHLAAVTHWHNEHWFGKFLDALVADPNAAVNNYYFDVATLHIYFQPETVYDLTVHYYRLMHNRDIYKPIWIAETNAAPSQDPAWPVPNAQFNISLEEQAIFIVQAFSLGLAAGAERIAVYKMADTETDRVADPEPFGLVRLDGSRRPAFTAYQVATTYLSGSRGGSWDRRDDISIVTIDRGTQTTTIVWARTPEPQAAMIPARTTRALLVNVWGAAYYVYPERGYYFLDLPGADCAQGCLMGGAPLMLVEDAPLNADTAPPPLSPTPPPVENADPDVIPDIPPVGRIEGDIEKIEEGLPTPTPTFTPTPTSTPTNTPIPTNTPTSTPTNTPTSAPTSTPTSALTPTPTITPTPTPVPLPTSDVPSGRPWLLVGILAAAMGGGAFVTNHRKPPHITRD